MNILDENIIENQCQLLIKWRVSFRQIGVDIGRDGMDDAEIITLLHQLRNPTFFTRDDDFYRKELRHRNYCIVYLAIRKEEAANFVRRFLRFNETNTVAKRMGNVIRVTQSGISILRLHYQKYLQFTWSK